MRVSSKIAVVAAAATTVLSVGLGPALADPPSGTTPALTDVAGTGSDTTQLVMDAISAHFDGTTPPPTNKLYSWDAVNPTTGGTGDTIITKASGPSDTTCSIARPNGSGAGIAALHATATDGGHPCLDYARSSRGPQAGDPTGLLWVGFAKDAVAWTTPKTGTGKPTTLTVAQLNAIYTCTDTKWNQVGGTSTATIVPALPQTASGTRAFFLSAIGVTTPGSCVVNGSINIPGDPNNPVPMEENTGISLKDSGGNYLTGNQFFFSSHQNAIYPYSAGVWIGQQPKPAGGGHGTSSSGSGALLIPQPVSGVSPILTHPGPPVTIDTINPAFSATMTRTVWNVMHNAGTKASPAIPTYLQPKFSATGGVCKDAADIKSFGFLPISNCGTDFATS